MHNFVTTFTYYCEPFCLWTWLFFFVPSRPAYLTHMPTTNVASVNLNFTYFFDDLNMAWALMVNLNVPKFLNYWLFFLNVFLFRNVVSSQWRGNCPLDRTGTHTDNQSVIPSSGATSFFLNVMYDNSPRIITRWD